MLNPVLRLRREAGLSQEQLAKAVGTTEQYVRRVETGMISDDADLSGFEAQLFAVINTRAREEDRISWRSALIDIATEYAKTAEVIGFDNLLLTEPLTIPGHRDNRDLPPLHRFMTDWKSLKRFTAANRFDDEYNARLEEKEYATFRSFREAVQVRLPGTVEVNGNPGKKKTLYAFCRDLALHPFIVQRFERNHGALSPRDPAPAWPDDLRTALRTLGVRLDGVTFRGNGK